jgi:hypothetical protein
MVSDTGGFPSEVSRSFMRARGARVAPLNHDNPPPRPLRAYSDS